MNALETYLTKLIKAQGPISIATYMGEALGNAQHGYYMKKDPFGQKGDFTTAPEISQMFGEMVGLWLGVCWLNMGSPDKIHLIELGPGRGTLMQDILRAMKVIPGLLDSIEVHLVEMSPVLREMQAERLKGLITPKWHNRVSDALDQSNGGPLLVIANEFFDALPIRQFQKTEDGWHERLVCLDEAENLSLQLAPVAAPESIIPPALLRADEGSITEVCAIGENLLSEIAEYIQRHSGAALIIDYGHDRHGTGNTLQAVKQHKYIDILSDPGDVDLTAHVDFQRLKEIAHICETKTFGPVGQGDFLKSLGIEARSQTLLANATDKQAKDIQTALNRLIHKDEMGDLFKVMAISDNGLSGIIGFE